MLLDYKDAVRAVVRRRLKEIGIKAPKLKLRSDYKIDHGSYDNPNAVFGIPLDRLTTKNIGCNDYCPVPRFLVEATTCLENHLSSEGLFRKSGSSVRQRQLRKTIEEGGTFAEAQPHDVASLLKQFFRELPEPLLTNQLHDHFLKSLQLGSKNEQTMAILLLCILLPIEHLYTLQYFVKFMSKVAEKSEESKMGTANLAIVLTPNFMHSAGKKDNVNSSEKLLKEQTLVVQILLENASGIGVVSEDILCEAKDSNINDAGLSSSDELDGERLGLRGRSRPTSISAFVTGKVNKFRQSNHRRSKSVKAEFSRQKRNVEVNIKAKDDCAMFTKHLVSTADLRGVMKDQKRKPLEREVDKDLAPLSKRKITSKDLQSQAQCHVISSPFSVTGSTQMFMTPKRPIPRTMPLSAQASSAKKDASHETQHVKVVDARNYESPEALRPGEITLEFTKLMGQTPVGDKYVFDSPHSATLSCDMKAKRAKRQGRSRANRRNSSGATRCFSSSPRSRNKPSKKNTPKETPLAREDRHGSNGSTTDENCNLISGGNSWLRNPEKSTPRRNTPPLPHLKNKPEFRTIFTENVF
ncbi:rho GTPase-activating protein 11A-like isoform X2 [Dendronephthya gigantea]|uniref:rho GTPase-activating protein 11A-like isoform X2 n=1 Tax=Dendronephthya gigantea TaxID=151771 RepID=UPI0010693F5B|nr:rho GTPase-activating protein 11A-like isoform X2 [Dendronephthya gigantea]